MSQNEILFCLTDIKKVFKKNKIIILIFSLFCSFCACLCFLISPVEYSAVATYKDSNEKKAGNIGIKEYFAMEMGVQPVYNKTVSMMKSRLILKGVVQKLGFQIKEIQNQKLLKKIGENVSCNWSLIRKKKISEKEFFEFQDVIYKKDETYELSIRFRSKESFEIFINPERVLSRGKINQIIKLSDIEFCLVKAPDNLEIGALYQFKVNSIDLAIEELSNQIEIGKESKNGTFQNNEILTIKAKDNNRFLAQKIANGLIEEYQHYLQKEHILMASKQLEYLKNKQYEITQELDKNLDEYVQFCNKNISKEGFIYLDQEVESIFKPYQQCHAKLSDINVEQKAQQNIQEYDPLVFNNENSNEILSIDKKIKELAYEKDVLNIALNLQEDFFSQENLNKINLRSKKIEDIQKQKTELLNITSDHQILGHYKSFQFNNFEGLKKNSYFSKYIEDYLHLLTIKEDLYKQRGINLSEEFQGSSLETLRDLHFEYNKKLDQLNVSIKEFGHILEELEKPDFEISAMSIILNDINSLNLIQGITSLQKSLKDEKNSTQKEKERYKEDINFEKNILIAHVQELIELKKLNVEVVKDKIKILQQSQLDAINQQILLLKDRYQSFVNGHLNKLDSQKKNLEDQMEQYKQQMLLIPEKRKLEKKLEMKSKMAMNMMDTITQLIESKTISYNIHNFESKTIDLAILPKIPESRPIIKYSFFIFIIFMILSSIFFIIRSLIKGFSVSFENLIASNYQVIGEMKLTKNESSIQNIQEANLEILRKVSSFIKNENPAPQLISLLLKEDSNFSHILANLIGMKGESVLLLSLCKEKENNLKAKIPVI